MNRSHYDAVIIGAGPSGSSTAFFLKEKLERVLLIDKVHFPRDKLCGGAISMKTIDLLNEYWGIPINSDIFGVEYSGGDVFFGEQLIRSISSEEYSLHLTLREEFDHLLVKKAVERGVEFMDGTSYSEIDTLNSKITINNQEITYDILVGADGVPSKVAKITGLTTNANSDIDSSTAMAYEVYVDKRDMKQEYSDIPKMYFDVVSYGYAWTFPKKDRIVVGIGALKSKNGDLREIFYNFLDRVGVDRKKIKVKGHWIPYGRAKKTIGKSNYFLVGDAAGFADPLFVEGIYYGILSGKLLAHAVNENTINGNIDNIMNIQTRYKKLSRIIRKELFYAWIIRNFLFRRFFMRLTMKSLRKSDEFAEYTMGLVSGAVSFRQFWYRSLRVIPKVIYNLIF